MTTKAISPRPKSQKLRIPPFGRIPILASVYQVPFKGGSGVTVVEEPKDASLDRATRRLGELCNQLANVRSPEAKLPTRQRAMAYARVVGDAEGEAYFILAAGVVDSASGAFREAEEAALEVVGRAQSNSQLQRKALVNLCDARLQLQKSQEAYTSALGAFAIAERHQTPTYQMFLGLAVSAFEVGRELEAKKALQELTARFPDDFIRTVTTMTNEPVSRVKHVPMFRAAIEACRKGVS